MRTSILKTIVILMAASVVLSACGGIPKVVLTTVEEQSPGASVVSVTEYTTDSIYNIGPNGGIYEQVSLKPDGSSVERQVYCVTYQTQAGVTEQLVIVESLDLVILNEQQALIDYYECD